MTLRPIYMLILAPVVPACTSPTGPERDRMVEIRGTITVDGIGVVRAPIGLHDIIPCETEFYCGDWDLTLITQTITRTDGTYVLRVARPPGGICGAGGVPPITDQRMFTVWGDSWYADAFCDDRLLDFDIQCADRASWPGVWGPVATLPWCGRPT